MKITAIRIENIRGFKKIPKTEFSKSINIFIGANNAGKSTILNCIFQLQRNVFSHTDVTLGNIEGQIELYFEGYHLPAIRSGQNYEKILFSLKSSASVPQRFFVFTNNTLAEWRDVIPEREPDNLVYPYLSKRKVAGYQDLVNEANANQVSGHFGNLFARIDKLINPFYQPAHNQYVMACKDVLGFVVSTDTRGNGKQAVYFVHQREHIPLTAMGEGVPNI